MLKLVLVTDETSQEMVVDTRANNLPTFKHMEDHLRRLGFQGGSEFWFGGLRLSSEQSVSAYLHSSTVICRIKPKTEKPGLMGLLSDCQSGLNIHNFFFHSIANFYGGERTDVTPQYERKSKGDKLEANPGIQPFDVAGPTNRKPEANGIHMKKQAADTDYRLDKREDMHVTNPMPNVTIESSKPSYEPRDGRGNYSLQHAKFTKSKDSAPQIQKSDPIKPTNLISHIERFVEPARPKQLEAKPAVGELGVENPPKTQNNGNSKIPPFRRLVEADLLMSSSSEVSEAEEIEEGEIVREQYAYVKVDVESLKTSNLEHLKGSLVCYRLITFDEADIPSISDNLYGVATQVDGDKIDISRVQDIDKALLITDIASNKQLHRSELVLIVDGSTNQSPHQSDRPVLVKTLNINSNSDLTNLDFFYILYYLGHTDDEKPVRVQIDEQAKPQTEVQPQEHEQTTVHTKATTADRNATLNKLDRLIGEQIDFYFSDKNYHKDKYIQEKVVEDPDKGLTLEDLMTFNRIKNFKVNLKRLKSALERYQEVKETSYKILPNGKIVKK